MSAGHTLLTIWAEVIHYNEVFLSHGWIFLSKLIPVTSDHLKCGLKKTRQTKHKPYSKICVKGPLKNRQNKDLNDKW